MVKKIESIARDTSFQDSKDIKLSYAQIDSNELKITTEGKTETYGEIISQEYQGWKDGNFPWNRR